MTVTLDGRVGAKINDFLKGVVADSGSYSGRLPCMMDIDANHVDKTVANCVGKSPGDNTKMSNAMLVSI